MRARPHAFDFPGLIAIRAGITDAVYISFGVGGVGAISRVRGAMRIGIFPAGDGAARLGGFAACRDTRYRMGCIGGAAGIHEDCFSPTRVDSLPPV